MAKIRKPIVVDLTTLQSAPLVTGDRPVYTPDLVEFGTEPLKSIDIGSLPGQDINERRADIQSNFKAVANSVASIPLQLVGEAVSGVGYLGMTPDQIETPNFLVRLGESIANADNEALPVYSHAENQEGFRPFNAEWWANNIPSVASSLSIFIPALAASKGFGIAGKMLRANRYIGKILTAIPEIGATAELLSATIPARHIESMMEATGTYEQALSEGRSPEEASEMAANNYKLNWLAMLTDLGQYASVLGIKLPGLPNIGLAGQLASESVEEFAQFVFNKESLLTDKEKKSSPFEVRLAEYFKDPEAQTSAFWGAFGAAIFQGGGKAIKRFADYLETRNNPTKAKANIIKDAVANGDIDDVKQTVGNLAKENNVDPPADFFNDLDSVASEPVLSEEQLDSRINQVLQYREADEINDNFNKVLVDGKIPFDPQSVYAEEFTNNRKDLEKIYGEETVKQMIAENPALETPTANKAALQNHPRSKEIKSIANNYLTAKAESIASAIQSKKDRQVAFDNISNEIDEFINNDDYTGYQDILAKSQLDPKLTNKLKGQLFDKYKESKKRIDVADTTPFETVEEFTAALNETDPLINAILADQFEAKTKNRLIEDIQSKFDKSKQEVPPAFEVVDTIDLENMPTDDDFGFESEDVPDTAPVIQDIEIQTEAEVIDEEYEPENLPGTFFVKGNEYQEISTPEAAARRRKYPKVLKRTIDNVVLREGEFDTKRSDYDPNRTNRYEVTFLHRGVQGVPSELEIRQFMRYPGKNLEDLVVKFKAIKNDRTKWSDTLPVNEDNFQLTVFVNKNGIDYPVGDLAALSTMRKTIDSGNYSGEVLIKMNQDYAALESLRKELWSKLQNTELGKFAEASNTSKIYKYDKGLLHTYPDKISIDQTLNSDEDAYLGVMLGGSVFVSNAGDMAFENDPSEFKAAKPGQLFFAKRGPTGDYRWFGAFAKKLGESSKFERVKEILNRLTEDTYDPTKEYQKLNDELRSIVKFKLSDGNYGPYISPDTHLRFQTDNTFDPAKYIDYYKLLEKPIQVDYTKIGDKSYVQNLFNSGDIVTNIRNYPYANPKFIVSAYHTNYTVEEARVIAKPKSESGYWSRVKTEEADYPAMVDYGGSSEFTELAGGHRRFFIPREVARKAFDAYTLKYDDNPNFPRQAFDKAHLKELGLKGGKADNDQTIEDRSGFSVSELDRFLPNWRTLSLEQMQKPVNEARTVEKPIVTNKGSFKFDTKRKFMQPVKDAKFKRISKVKAINDLRQILPSGISIRFMERLMDEHGAEVWGYVENASVTLSDTAIEGAQYHEAWHIIEDYLLTDKEKNDLYAQLPKVSDKSEYLAEAFREYMMTNDTSLGYLIKRFFRYIGNFIRDILGLRPSIRQVFDRAAKGSFKERTPLRNSLDRKYMRIIDGVSKREYANIFLSIAGDYFLNFANKNELQKAISSNIDRNIFTRLEGDSVITAAIIISHHNNGSKEEMLNAVRMLRPDIESFTVEDDEQTVSFTLKGTKRFGNLYSEIVKGIGKRGYKLKLGSVQVVEHHSEELEYDEDSDLRETWMENIQLVSYLERLSPEIKRLINGVTERNDNLGLNIGVNYSGYNVFSRILPVISSSLSVEEMIAKIQNSPDPFFKKFDEYIRDRHIKPNELYGKLYYAIGQQVHPRYIVVSKRGYSDQFGMPQTINSVYDSNRLSLKSIISRLFTNKDFRSKFKEDLTRDEVKKIFIEYGLGHRVVDLMTEEKPYKNLIKNLILAPSELNDNFSGSVTKGKKENTYKILNKYYPYDYLEAHLNVEGKRQYEYTNPSFITRLLIGFRKNMLKERYNTDPMYSNLPILNDINTPFEFVMVDGYTDEVNDRKVMYTDFTPNDTFRVMFNQWANDNIYPLPVPSDSPNMIGVQLNKPKTVDEAINDILILVKNEIARTKNTNRLGIKNYKDKAGEIILFKDVADRIMQYGSDIFVANDSTILKAIGEVIDYYAADLAPSIEANKDSLILSKVNGEKIADKAKTFVSNYMSNYSQLMILSSGDPAFYKNIEDYFKRAKQVISPVKKVDPKAVYKDAANQQYDIPNRLMRITILKDIEVPSSQYGEIKHALESIGKGDQISKYEGISHTDAQSYIDLHSYRWREIGLYRWSDAKQLAFDYMLQGKGSDEIIKIGKQKYGAEFGDTLEFTVLKPYYYAHLILNDGNLVSPFQKKDSEFMITPFYGIEKFGKIDNPLYNPFYKKMLEAFGYSFNGSNVNYNPKKRKTDVFSFNTAIKDGERNTITVDDEFDASVEVPFGEWGLQQETPKHHYDTDDIFGTQIMKLVMSGFRSDNEMMQRYKQEYNDLIVTDIQESYDKLVEELNVRDADGTVNESKTFWNVIRILRDELINRGMRDEYLEALEQVGDKTKLPTWFPLHSYRIESLLFSLVKNRVAKQKFINGFSFVNTSSYGFKRQPKIKWVNDDPAQGIDYFEAYAPIHDKRLRQYVNEYGFIDEEGMNKIRASEDADLLEGIIYRIPTEDKYSMFRIKIIGFLPYDEGAVILPLEVTLLAGLDFDIDKVRGFFKKRFTDKEVIGLALKENKNLKKELYALKGELKEELQKTNPDIIELYKHRYAVEDAIIDGEDLSDELEAIDEKIATLKAEDKENKNLIRNEINERIAQSQVRLLELGKQSYTYRKNERDNRKITLMGYALTSPESLIHQVVPGGFDRLKDINRQIRFLSANPSPEQLNKFNGLSERSKDELLKDKMSYNVPQTFIKVVQRMLAGKALVGIMANHNAVHALMQDKNLELPVLELTENGFQTGYVTYQEGDKSWDLRSISRIYDIEGNPISRNFAENLAAVVDNGKDPQAEYFGLNIESSATYNLLLHLGLPLRTAMYFSKVTANATKAELPKGYKLEPIVFEELETLLRHPENEDLVGKYSRILTYLMKYARLTNDLITAVKIGDAGTGPTQISNMFKLLTVKKAISGNDFNLIENVEDFFAERTFTNELIRKVSEGNQFIVSAARLLPINGTMGQQVLEHADQYLKGYMDEDFANSIYRNLLAYYSSSIDFFKFNPITRTHIHNAVTKYKILYPDNEFLNRLFYDPDTDSLKLVGANSNDELEIQQIIDGWAKLLTGDEKTSLFGQALIKYAFWTNGYSFSMNGFSHLIPVSAYELIPELGDAYIEAIGKANELDFVNATSNRVNMFYEQFVKSNYRKLIEDKRLQQLWHKNSSLDSRAKEFPQTIEANREDFNYKDFAYVRLNGEVKLYRLEHNTYHLLNEGYAGYKGDIKLYQQYDYENVESITDKINIYDNINVTPMPDKPVENINVPNTTVIEGEYETDLKLTEPFTGEKLAALNDKWKKQRDDKDIDVPIINNGSDTNVGTITKELGEEISSNAKGLAGALTNMTELAKRKGNIAQSYPVTFRGKTYKDSETVYQDLKHTATKDDGPDNTYNLMVDIITAKLEQYPRLVSEITKRGGSSWILASTHQPTRKNSVWETGGQNWFIKALNDAYLKVISKTETFKEDPNAKWSYKGDIEGDVIGSIDLGSEQTFEDADKFNNPEIELGRYVKFENEAYLVTRLDLDKGLAQIVNPTAEGSNKNKQVAIRNLEPMKFKAVPVEYKNKLYFVTSKGTIISETTGKAMQWGEENGDRKAILELAEYNPNNPLNSECNTKKLK